MASQIPFEQHRKLLLSTAHRVKRRLHAAGAQSVQFEDIFQELVCAWCVARDKWEPSRQVPFGAYLMKGMSDHINRWVQHELRQRHLAAIDLDASPGEEDMGSLHDIIPDNTRPNPEAALIESDIIDFANDPLRWKRRPNGWPQPKPLTPNAKKFVELISDPPLSVIKIFEATKARAKYAREVLNIPSVVTSSNITGSFIFDVMGIEDRKERADIYQQIKRLGDRVNQQ